MTTVEFRNCFANLRETRGSLVNKLLSEPDAQVGILSHKNPDGDAIGSALGLSLVLKNMGYTTTVGIPDRAPASLRWLPGYNEIVTYEYHKEQLERLLGECEYLVIVDLSHPDRMGDMASLLENYQGQVILIDHHPSQGEFANESYIDIGYGSTSEMIFHFIAALDKKKYVTEDAATSLLTGIITDTLGFKVASSYPEVFQATMELMALGANKDRIFDQVYNQQSENRFRLLGFSLASRMNIYPDAQAACIYLSQSDLESFDHKKGDTDGFVNYPLSIKDIRFSILFTEQKDQIKLSLRSVGDFDVNLLARQYFHGGGHRNAAGGKYFGTMEEAIACFEKILEDLNA